MGPWELEFVQCDGNWMSVLDYLHICLVLILIVAMVLHLRSLTSLNVMPEGHTHKHISKSHPQSVKTHISRNGLEGSSGES